ncbi:TetR family transcriptional regulator [Roseibium aquae]|uniref:TetR family transcriptional regulator n=1 Tax=Roseibium aquae TaxID=1323746 RepID=A0A916WY21_9HYPH|nr:TetR/AcrR family transcriptional regulator [Roseibium aquae]GGB41342.1 TetR family transcriptional regulator [Roseibium aquae]
MTEHHLLEKSAKTGAASPGRPRAFDEAEVLEAALQVFWRQGFEATSLDDLTSAMGLSRSSFYGAFGSKRGVLAAALECYSNTALSRLKAVADEVREDPAGAMLIALADPAGGQKGCLLVNCITELAPHHEEVAGLGQRHLSEIERLFAEAIDPLAPDQARDRARALTALAIGTVTLRKSGVAPDQISRSLAAARAILHPQRSQD